MGFFSRGRETREAGAELRLIASVAHEAISKDVVAQATFPDAFFVGFIMGVLEICASPLAGRSLEGKHKENVVRAAFRDSDLSPDQLLIDSDIYLQASNAQYFAGRTEGAKVGRVWLNKLHEGADVRRANELGFRQVSKMEYARHGKVSIWQASAIHLTDIVFANHIRDHYGG